MSINLRSRLDGVEVDAVCSGRFFDRVEKRGACGGSQGAR